MEKKHVSAFALYQNALLTSTPEVKTSSVKVLRVKLLLLVFARLQVQIGHVFFYSVLFCRQTSTVLTNQLK